MRFDLTLSVTAIILSGVLIGSAAAQTSGQSAGQNGANGNGAVQADSNSSPAAGNAASPPERLSDGTLAESASTTALATPTYHQPRGFLPGMKP